MRPRRCECDAPSVVDLLGARLELASGHAGAAHAAAETLAERASARGARRYEILARLLASEAAARAGERVDPASVAALRAQVPDVGGPDAWWFIAACAAATGIEACSRLAAERAAALEQALPEELRPALRRYAGTRLERISTAGRRG